MGTKKQIVSDVVEVVRGAKSGPFLDLFSGISSVGVGVAPARQVWCNDAQNFAYTLATAKFTSKSSPAIDASLLSDILDRTQFNGSRLLMKLGRSVLEEDICLHEGEISAVCRLVKKQILSADSNVASDIRSTHRLDRKKTPYCLFSISYVGGYLGARQAFDIDSLRYAIDSLRWDGEISVDQHRWFVLALCKALFAVSNTTGHFAQYLDVKPSTLARFLAKRRRNVLTEWLHAVRDLAPAGTEAWRRENRTFRGDATKLLLKLKKQDMRPAVIYADPPYTGDQYSRYYHLLETLLDYDYPDLSGKGQYRPDRFVSDFSKKTKVAAAFDTLVSGVADLNAELIINYPKNGLLADTKASLLATMRKYYSHAEVAAEIAHEHSSLGASKGIERSAVTELIFYAR